MEDPLHPYTRGLIDALPSRGMKPIPLPAKEREGKEAGCVFYPRCERACPRCAEEKPKDFLCGDGRKVRCFLLCLKWKS